MNPVAAHARKEKKRQLEKNALKRAAVRAEKLATASVDELQQEIAKLDRAAKSHAAATGGQHHQALDRKKKLDSHTHKSASTTLRVTLRRTRCRHEAPEESHTLPSHRSLVSQLDCCKIDTRCFMFCPADRLWRTMHQHLVLILAHNSTSAIRHQS